MKHLNGLAGMSGPSVPSNVRLEHDIDKGCVFQIPVGQFHAPAMLFNLKLAMTEVVIIHIVLLASTQDTGNVLLFQSIIVNNENTVTSSGL